ncbi:hypothetical protein [Nocardioides massiliensis]|uniref:Uncharacterized protein n=1 Tax=Nocardioides massiliensis TaxID=1325935 RepID=A0ABT9NUD9_9ACTN|nr:hypothetical protein [Nocardioides massiliensis]MDP9824038.1 hypothetical protein [Nocardioides massiliensis]
MVQPTTPTAYVLGPDAGEALWFLGNLVILKATGAHTRGQLTVAEFVNPAGFAPPLHRHVVEDARAAGEPAARRALPDPGPIDPTALGHAAAQHGIELLGPPAALTDGRGDPPDLCCVHGSTAGPARGASTPRVPRAAEGAVP